MANTSSEAFKSSWQRHRRLYVCGRIGLSLLLTVLVNGAMGEPAVPGTFRATGARFTILTPPNEVLTRIEAATKRGAQSTEKLTGNEFPADLLAEIRRDALTEWAVKEVLSANRPGETFSLALPVEYNLYPGPNRLRIQSSARSSVGPHDDCYQVTVTLDAEGKPPKVKSQPICRVERTWRAIQ